MHTGPDRALATCSTSFVKCRAGTSGCSRTKNRTSVDVADTRRVRQVQSVVEQKGGGLLWNTRHSG
eukprot:6174431-Pleurochrysis_carterae.AAC.1